MNTNFNMPSSDDDNTCATCLYRFEHCECRPVADSGPVLWPQHLIDELINDQVFVYFEPLDELDPDWDLVVSVPGELVLAQAAI